MVSYTAQTNIYTKQNKTKQTPYNLDDSAKIRYVSEIEIVADTYYSEESIPSIIFFYEKLIGLFS